MSNEIRLKINALIDALRTEEQEEKRRYNAAIDIEDMTEAKEVMLDARTKILQLRKWTESLTIIQEEVVSSCLATQETFESDIIISEAKENANLELIKAESAQEQHTEPNNEDSSFSALPEVTITPIIAQTSEELVYISDEDIPKEILEEYDSTDNSTPTECTIFGKSYSVKSWDDVLIKLCEVMILKNPYKSLTIGVKQSVQLGGIPVIWFDECEESSESYKLSNGLSVAKNKTIEETKFCCERILNLCGYDRSELKIS